MAVAMTLLRFASGLSDRIGVGQALLGLVAVAVGGGVGGAVYYGTDVYRAKGGAAKTAANVVSLLSYAFASVGVLLVIFGAE